LLLTVHDSGLISSLLRIFFHNFTILSEIGHSAFRRTFLGVPLFLREIPDETYIDCRAGKSETAFALMEADNTYILKIIFVHLLRITTCKSFVQRVPQT
jgi:hypothetical protein